MGTEVSTKINKLSIEERKVISDAKLEARKVKAEEQSNQNTVYFICLFIFAAILIAGNFFWFFGLNDQSVSNKVSDWGAFGDFIGGLLNPAVAGIGLIFFIKTLKQNEEALRMSAEELAETRFELERSTEAQSSMAQSSHDQFQNTLAIRKMDEITKSHDFFHASLLKLLNSVQIDIRFSEERKESLSVESAMLSMYSKRKKCLIIPKTSRENLLETFSDLTESALVLALLYKDMKSENFNAYRPEGYEKTHITPSSHQDLINFCRFISLSSIQDEDSEHERLTDNALIRTKVEGIAYHIGLGVDKMSDGFDEYAEITFQPISMNY